MKRTLSVLFLAQFWAILVASAAAQTVMTASIALAPDWQYNDLEQRSDSRSVKARELLTTFESGIMDTLFASGFICFNQPPQIESQNDAAISTPNALLNARRLGAGYTIIISSTVEFTATGNAANIRGTLELYKSQGELLAKTAFQSTGIGTAATLGKSLASGLLQESGMGW